MGGMDKLKDSWEPNPTKRHGWVPCAIVGGLILALLSGLCTGIFIGNVCCQTW